ncbi:cytochrome c oxidase assembly factor 7-like [Saccostrea cucullata]|uniref:cytochrome c oxidase assembly factor 7-like n=1 Tax=Saccostrea cuccullata TaxID=36930 RepID=UPI002ED31E6A
MSRGNSEYDLRDANQVKEYLQNVLIEYQYSCFKEEDPTGCHRLGYFHGYVDKDKEDAKEKAKQIFKMNCEKYKFGQSCDSLAGMILHDKKYLTEKADRDDIIKYFKLACDNHYYTACKNLGVLMLDKNEMWKDYHDTKKGRELLHMACEKKNVDSCYILQRLYSKKSPEKTLEYALKGCELDDGKSCVTAYQLYLKGFGVERNTELANFYKERASYIQRHHIATKPDESVRVTM